MLKICKSCKALVDTNKHDFCPKCGANFNFDERKHIENSQHNEKVEEKFAKQRREAVEKQMRNRKELHLDYNKDEQFEKELAQRRRDAVESQMVPPKDTQPKYDPYKYSSHSNQQSVQPSQTIPEAPKPVNHTNGTMPTAPKPANQSQRTEAEQKLVSTISEVKEQKIEQIRQRTNYKSAQHSSPTPQNTYNYGNQGSYKTNKPNDKDKKGNGFKGCATIIIALCTVFPVITNCIADISEEEDYDYSVEYTYPPAVQAEKEYDIIYGEDKTKDFEIKCFDMLEVSESYYEPEEGYINVAFGLAIENTGSETLDIFDMVECWVDGEKMSVAYSPDYLFFSIPDLAVGEIYEGYTAFEIPKTAKVIKLTYEKAELRVDNIFYEKPVIEAPDQIPPSVDADFIPISEYNSTPERSLCCNGVKYIDALMGEPAEGNVYMAFNLIVGVDEKGAQIYDYPVCYADGAEAEMYTLTKYGIFMPGEIDVNGVFEGVVCFEVPENTMNFRIEYEGVTLEFENPLNTDYIDVELYEFAEMGDIAFACSGIDTPTYMAEQPKKEGYDDILLEFYALNQGNEAVYNQDIPQCYVNGELMEINYNIKDNIFYIGELNPTEAARGYVCYEIPTDAQQLEIIFSERVKITIDGPFFQ